ncbi:MAG: pantoate--beta-alanine ligase [Ignavibacteria bacterium]|nr:pantoate--beta-alanine ligase [Ignavibacteria bacterium]
MSLNVIQSISDMQSISNALRKEGKSIACVPTMGYLHEGHASLIREAVKHHDIVITTIFVNPLQFGPKEDFERYPRDPERDIAIISAAGGKYVFIPSIDEMYPPEFQTTISIGNISKSFEGLYRPGHFEGVATVVAKLFAATKPDAAYFGQKDYQQTLVIKQMVKDLNMGIDIQVIPTLRESTGLAMSSRNVYLSPEEKKSALVLQSALQTGLSLIRDGNRRRISIEESMKAILAGCPEFEIQYCNAALGDTLEMPDEFSETDQIVLLIAGLLGKTRLIDNMTWSSK